MSSRYFAPAGVDDILKLKMAGFPLFRVYASIPRLDFDYYDDPSYPVKIPFVDESSTKWRVRLGYLVYELDPALSLAKGKTGDALTDGSLTTAVTFTLAGIPGAWTNLGPAIDVGAVGDYLYFLKTDWSYDPTLSKPSLFMRVVANPGNEVVTLADVDKLYTVNATVSPAPPVGVLFKGRQSFQLQALNIRPAATFSAATVNVYEISIYRV
jgi:hypothetical protein